MIKAARFVAAIALSLSASAHAGGLYFFGDSLSDTGNTSTYFGGALPTITPGTPYAPGQWTDNQGGGVWSAQFAAVYGSSIDSRASLLGGGNFAWAGARSYSFAGGVPGLDQQVGAYLSLPGTSRANDLFVIMIGGNDVKPIATDAGNAAAAVLGGGGTPSQANLAFAGAVATGVTSGLTNILNAVNTLYADGGRHFLIANMPDVGATPNVRLQGPATVGAVNAVVNAWNTNFNSLVLSMSGIPGIDVDVLDLYGLATQSPAYYAALGFTNTTDTCFVSATTATLQDCRTYFFSDDFHPTSAAHALIAQTALKAVPTPATLALFAIGLLGLAGMRRKQA